MIPVVYLVIALLPSVALLASVAHAELSPQEQQAVARRLGDKVQRFEMWTDNDGNVTGLIFINHQSLTKSVGDKPGINDSDLTRTRSVPGTSCGQFRGPANWRWWACCAQAVSASETGRVSLHGEGKGCSSIARLHRRDRQDAST